MEWIPVVVMVLVALRHRYRVCRVDQSAWKGGGFAMFSVASRSVVVPQLILPHRNDDMSTVPVATLLHNWPMGIPPTERNVLRWGRQLLARDWMCCGNVAHMALQYSPGVCLSVAGIQLDVYRLTFDASTGRHAASRQSSYTLPSTVRQLPPADD